MVRTLQDVQRALSICSDHGADCSGCPYIGEKTCTCAALADLVVALQQQQHESDHTALACPEKKKAQLWDAIFPAILQCASGDSGLHINQLYEVYMRGTKYTDDLVCSMSKLLIRAAESHVYSRDTALVCETVKILVGEVFENCGNQKEEE